MTHLFSVTAFSICLAAPLAAQDCTPVTVDSDLRLTGMAPAEGYICFDLSVAGDNNLSLEVLEGNNTAFTVLGYVDARAERTFLGDLPETVEMRVFQLFRAPADQDFAIAVRLEPPGNG